MFFRRGFYRRGFVASFFKRDVFVYALPVCLSSSSVVQPILPSREFLYRKQDGGIDRLNILITILENKAVKEAALIQIGMFNCIVGIKFTATQDANRTNAIVACVYRLASQLAGFVLYPNMYLFQGDDRLLISIDGKTDMTEFRPMADARILDSEQPETEADIARRKRSIAICRQKGLPGFRTVFPNDKLPGGTVWLQEHTFPQGA